VQTHAVLSDFVSVVVEGVRASHNNLAIGAVKKFQQRCDTELSSSREIIAVLNASCVQPYLDVYEAEKGVPQEYRYVAPDDAQGFNVTSHFQGLDDLQLQQSKQITHLTEIFATSGNVCSDYYIHMCKIYLERCSKIRDFLNELSVELVSAKAEGFAKSVERKLADLRINSFKSASIGAKCYCSRRRKGRGARA